MKIEKLIDVFEKLLPIYEKGMEKGLYRNELSMGICHASEEILHTDIRNVMSVDGYYTNYIVKEGVFGLLAYLFPKGDLKPRIDFMKSEIKSLKRLQKKGYTHV